MKNDVNDDFYVEAKCCMFCGVPQAIAPELVGWKLSETSQFEHCYWIRQPANDDELTRAINIIHAQELGCHRYAGNDPQILRRLPAEECDALHPRKPASMWPEWLKTSTAPVRLSLSASEGGLLSRLWRQFFRKE
jgi:hypothetical protein